MWYVIWGTAKSENALMESIRRNVPGKYYKRVWTPIKEELRKYHGEEILKEVKLFPGYVLIDTEDADEVYRRICRDKHFIRFLKNEDEYAPVTEEEQTIIRRLTGEDGRAGVSLGVISGGQLRILDGPLKGMERDIVKIDRHKKKAWLKLGYMLGQDRTLGFALEVVEKSL